MQEGDQLQRPSLSDIYPAVSIQTITVVADGTDHHVVSYYTEDDVLSGRLQRPASREDLANVTVSPSMVRSTNFRYPPHIETGLDGQQYV